MPTLSVSRDVGSALSEQGDERSESELVRATREGDLSAFDELVRRYRARLHATIYHMTANRSDADDLTQETFIKAYQSLASFKEYSSFFTWTYRIAVNKTINFLKKRNRRKFVPFDLNDIDPSGEDWSLVREFVFESTPRRDLKLKELQGKISEAMMKLSETHRLVVIMHDIQGMSHEEIGAVTHCKTGTVRSRLHYARQQLQAYLSKYLD